MIQEERFIKIVNYLTINQTASLAELASISEVSIDTIRRDLEQLESNDMVKRVRGGAIINNNDLSNPTLPIHGSAQREEKKELAELVGRIVVDGQAVALNSGITNIEIAKFLVENYYRLTILTNNLHVLNVLAVAKKFTAIVPGGIIDPKEGAILGERCEQDILNYNIDTALIAVNAVSLEKGVTDYDLNKTGIIHSMLKSAKHKVIVADYSKFDRVECMNVCGLDEIDSIITDSRLTPEIIQGFVKKNVQIITPQR